jgi:hypothetical protein
MGIRFVDQEGFHRAAVCMAGAGFAAGALASVLPEPVPPALAGGVVGAAIGIGLAHGKLAWRLVAATLALVAFGVLVKIDVWAALAGCAAIGAVGLAVGERARRPLALGLGAIAMFAAAWAALRISYAEQTASWPTWLAVAAGSTALAFASVLALVPARIGWVRDAIGGRLRMLPDGLDPEVRGLCDRSIALWASGKDKIADAASRELLRDGVDKVLEVAHRTAQASSAPADDADLDERIGELDRRIAAAADAVTRDQYRAARAALDDQKRLRERMRTGRERIVARMHNHVATLERFHLAALGVEATRVTADATTPLTELSADVASSSEALAEIALAVDPATPVAEPPVPEPVAEAPAN